MLDLDPNWDVKLNSQSLERIGFRFILLGTEAKYKLGCDISLILKHPKISRYSNSKFLGSNVPLNVSNEIKTN